MKQAPCLSTIILDVSAVSQLAEKNACKYFTAFNFSTYIRFFVQVLMVTNVNISY